MLLQGLPLSLSGVRAIMDRMDWGDATDFVGFGHVGADQVDEAQYYVLIAPQNVVGNTIMTPLLDMVHSPIPLHWYLFFFATLMPWKTPKGPLYLHAWIHAISEFSLNFL